MNKIIEKTYSLIDELDKSNIIKNITIYKEKILSNKEIKVLLDKSKSTDDEYILYDIKQQLYKYNDYKQYMHYYNELNYIVMDINNRFKKLTNTNICSR
ncbi:MAG: hypothetical protein IKF19_06765 [Bacilli bacterium]|nr:hypothetical protein [Bacilli bacterium]